MPRIKHGKPTKYGWTVFYPKNFCLGNYTDIGIDTRIFCHCLVVIEDCVQIGGKCIIYTKDTEGGKEGQVYIQAGAKIGAMSLIMPGVTIGENAVVGANSVVKCDIPDGETWAGTPAKKINKYRRVG